MQYFNIQVASQLSGVASATIRAWEKRYNAVVPERADNKHRLYSNKDIEKLAVLYRLTEVGQSIGKIAHLELEALKEIYCSLLHKPYDEAQVVTINHDRIDFSKMLMSFQIALAAYKIDIISHELEKAKSLVSPRDLCLRILIPLFQDIGIKVEKKELSIAQEHTLSAIVSFHVGQMIGQHYQKAHAKEELILISTPEGELHQIGILACSLLCVQYGIRFIYLGPNLPAESLAEAANALKPKAILLGTTSGDKEALDEFLNDYHSKLSVCCELLIGGVVKPLMRNSLEKRKIPFFPTIEAFDQYLERF